MNLSNEEYQRLMDYQDEKGFRVIYPMPATHMTDFVMGNRGANFWYKLKNEASTNSGEAVYDENGQYIPNYLTSSDREKAGYRSLRLENDNGGEDGNTWFVYAVRNQSGVKVRVNYYEYFRFKNGFDPVFYFGTNDYGQDIFSCLASGGRLSFILALSVSFINFIIGACYGAVEGYYGGAVDMVMERISDILGYMPFVVVATLFNLHLQPYVGPVVALLFAFILTGWIGMASRVRMQFYRFKGQEYVLAARTLGASDRRLIFKHIFPNSLGTIITGSVLQIPGVIFTESILSYLGIINLETSDITSIGTMLANGQGTLSTFPHIILFPALFISILEISFNLFGNGLRDAFNPSLRGAED
jgi:oligopeptide transport system permease protein